MISNGDVCGSLAEWIMSVSSTNVNPARTSAGNNRSERIDRAHPFCLIIERRTVLVAKIIASPSPFPLPTPCKGLDKNDHP